jgi:4-hydroxy-4-methyl-2-oxoglutarate aldolase
LSVASNLSDTDLVARFAKVQSGVVCDALGRLGLAGFVSGIHPVRADAKMVGRARTLRFAARRGTARPGLNPYAVIRSLAPGDVLVFATDRVDAWIFGENIASAAHHQKLAGIVTDACARDGAALKAHALPCFVAGLATRPPSAIEIVAADVPVDLGGAQILPNDFLVGDADGIVVVPGDRAREILVQVEDLAELEILQGRAIAAGAPLPQLLEILAKKKTPK